MSKNTKHEDDVQTIREVALAVDGTVRAAYSGKGMYGRLCYGIVCENPNRCLEEAGNRGLTHGLVDSMGLQSIVYWPHVTNGGVIEDLK
jgi:hypothetical protein